MPNTQVGNSPTERKNLSINREDWSSLTFLSKKVFNINSVSSLIRLFLRTWQKWGNIDFGKVSYKLIENGYENNLNGLLKMVRNENDRIQNMNKQDSTIENEIRKMMENKNNGISM